MAEPQSFVRTLNRALTGFYRWPAERQMLTCTLLWLYLAVVLRIIFLDGGLPSPYENWISLITVLLGVLAGPWIALVTALVCIVLISPVGMLAQPGTGWLVSASEYVTAAAIGGILQRLLVWLNAELDKAQHQHPGTQLPNVRAAQAYLDALLKSGRMSNKELDVLSLRLHNLDKIRRHAGQGTVDELVKILAQQLQKKLGDGSHVSQLSGDELLGIQSAGGRNIDEVRSLVDDVLNKPIQFEGKEYQLQGSAGLHRAAAEKGKLSAHEWLEKASAASLDARDTRQGFVADPPPASVSVPAGSKEDVGSRQVHQAMEQNELALQFLPRLNTRTGYFAALEARIVWHNPRRGDLQLDEFKSMLTDARIAQHMSLWMARLAFAEADDWAKHGYQFRLSLRLDTNGFLPPPVLAYVHAEMSQRQYRPGWLAVEIGESVLMRADDKLLAYLRHLQAAQVAVVVADYDNNSRTVQELAMLPVDAVKFSAGFIDQALQHSDARRQLGAVIKLLQSRGLVSIADGVRSSTALRMLRTLSCDELQGALLSKPLASPDIPWSRIRV